ncbi:hypothetical protein AB204_02355 [Xenorhabdus khoisanae]|uniref:Uncharacterized protein n=1 Tax=Xenorhabdus khoisanae TaxID=880157 RepID=A0A0J5FXK2_9GAMM|nr:hypothetical protein [Xenorhabdus khoisanae]KMJ46682.1 hypothetical protein AB204_02355 [Xenorhabdus khoisanae]
MSSLLAIKAQALNEAGIATTKFREDYQSLTGHHSKRKMMMSAIRCGYIIEKAGLAPLLSLLDTEAFFAADQNTRKQMVMRVLALSNMEETPTTPVEPDMTTVEIETPPATAKAIIQPEEPANNGTGAPSENTTSIIKHEKREDGSATLIERSTNKQPPPSTLSAMSALRGNVTKK